VGLGAINFITGMGGFLQAVMSGYAGLRIQEEFLSCDPKLPYGITNLTIQGVTVTLALFG
jgi:protein-glucosylgalactosylhydroxylysine glucosidase